MLRSVFITRHRMASPFPPIPTPFRPCYRRRIVVVAFLLLALLCIFRCFLINGCLASLLLLILFCVSVSLFQCGLIYLCRLWLIDFRQCPLSHWQYCPHDNHFMVVVAITSWGSSPCPFTICNYLMRPMERLGSFLVP